MTWTEALFGFFATLTVGAALGVLLFRNVLYAAFCLLLTFLGVAGLYVLAGADFVAVVQMMIYVGGVLVLLLFGIMLTRRGSEAYPISGSYNRWLAGLAAAGLLGVFTWIIVQVNFNAVTWLQPAQRTAPTASTLPGVGVQLMTQNLLPFEVAGVLLLVALIGAAYIAGKK